MNFPEDTGKVPSDKKGLIRQLTWGGETAQSAKPLPRMYEGLSVDSSRGSRELNADCQA